MKLSAAIFALTATFSSSVAATGMTRNTNDARKSVEDASALHHRKLAGADKYKTAGLGANADVYWQDDSCEYSSYVSLSASNGVTKYQSNGKPTQYPADTYAFGYFDIYSDCTDTTATYMYGYIDSYGGMDSSLTVNKKLASASYTSSNSDVFFVTSTCQKICYTPSYNFTDDFVFDDDSIGGEYCYYGDCTTISDGYATASVTASWTATGTASTYSSTNKYNGPGYSSRYTSKGKERPASVVLSIELDGVAIDIPASADNYATIQQSTSGEIYKY